MNLCECDNEEREFGCEENPMNLCECDSENRERGVGASVNGTMLSETLQVVGFAEAAGRTVRLRKKTHELVCMR